IPPGGFDPSVSLFAGSGPFATFVASSDDGLCPPGTLSDGACRDSTLTANLTAGTYTVVVSAFENLSFAENLGSGTLADGFVALGNFDESRTGNFAIDIIGGGVSAISATAVPAIEPPLTVVLVMLCVATGLAVLWRRAR